MTNEGGGRARLDLSDFAEARTSTSVLQLITTLAALTAWWWLTAATAHVSWVLTAAMAFVGTGLRVRSMLLQHDCGHRSLFHSQLANDVVGSALGVLGWAPFFYWQRTHAMHHVNSSRTEGREELGSIMTFTVREYEALTPANRLLYRVYRNPIFLCCVGGPLQFLIKHRFPWDTPRSWRKAWVSVLGTNLGLIGMTWLLASHWGLKTVLQVELPVICMSSFVAVWLIYIQHVFPGGYFAAGKAWNLEEASIRGSSYYLLPRLLRWCTANVGIHQVHHYSPKIPNYRLQECLDAHSEFQVKPLTLTDSLQCWKLKLWDEESGQFVAFPSEFSPARSALTSTLE
jgi:omega-6 fatty acid desaturase (delta-12 desaturase)